MGKKDGRMACDQVLSLGLTKSRKVRFFLVPYGLAGFPCIRCRIEYGLRLSFAGFESNHPIV
jgi:hypothetical protein